MDATCTIQDSIHVFSLVHKYVSRILGTYQRIDAFFLCKKCVKKQIVQKHSTIPKRDRLEKPKITTKKEK